MTTAIDLSQLPAPEVLEELDYESILAERKAALVALYSSDEQAGIERLLEIESEPLTKLLEESAYRELLLRQRINDAAQAVMLAHAKGSDLDQIGANYGVERLMIDAGDSSAVPPVPPTYESDSEFRRRIQLSPEGYTTAGSEQSYVYHALSADADVLDASAVTPAPGAVTVYVLSRTGDGSAPAATLSAVEAAVNDQAIRPMTDNVVVQSASIVEYAITAELTMLPGPDAAVVRDAAIEAAEAYAERQHAMRRDITLSGIYAALHQSGVQNVALSSPAADIVIGDGEASYCTGITVTTAENTDV
ncbi:MULTISPECIES: baseplate J/gp47 family protein [unclassified Halomonas]|uniref:baseplate assembly protein n=1 Tax=unclassified Halomonas TaxID=2609666 RepID=UPI00288648D1|nr:MULTISPECIES: baseplate J/gp47 family protein [unclassified Halomonas]MDT0499710.1 baseplate J/gp47 family protein [Halomonas sp. PAR7]MDT0510473.1 baseplate J/gp47 family protein [Halomonas sp. LES1]MDT0589818.1 baseplate J/gp47 family protein [Halomonas sp. PAR8]